MVHPSFATKSSIYRGVTQVGKINKSYKAQIKIRREKRRHLGTFDTEKEAAIAYDREALKAGRPTTELNFPDLLHDLEHSESEWEDADEEDEEHYTKTRNSKKRKREYRVKGRGADFVLPTKEQPIVRDSKGRILKFAPRKKKRADRRKKSKRFTRTNTRCQTTCHSFI